VPTARRTDTLRFPPGCDLDLLAPEEDDLNQLREQRRVHDRASGVCLREPELTGELRWEEAPAACPATEAYFSPLLHIAVLTKVEIRIHNARSRPPRRLA